MFESESPTRHSIETVIMGVLGIAIIFVSLYTSLPQSLNSIQETIVLVIALGGIMGITHIELPRMLGKNPRNPVQSVWMSGVISAVMDSFLVLLMVKKDRLTGSDDAKLKYRTYTMMAALIGGLMLYFGEVYALPLALQYGMRQWYAMLPIVPPVLVFLTLLGYLTSKLDLTIEAAEHGTVTADKGDYLEFAAVIIILLVTHNALLVLGLLLAYASATGQGTDLIHVIKTETEMSVMMLLVLAAFISEPIEPYMAHFTGYLALIPTAINGVLVGAMYPTSGDAWFDMSILSTGVLVLPISSLVGVILFPSLQEWKRYVMLSIPLATFWFVTVFSWFIFVWPFLDAVFYGIFPRPALAP